MGTSETRERLRFMQIAMKYLEFVDSDHANVRPRGLYMGAGKHTINLYMPVFRDKAVDALTEILAREIREAERRGRDELLAEQAEAREVAGLGA